MPTRPAPLLPISDRIGQHPMVAVVAAAAVGICIDRWVPISLSIPFATTLSAVLVWCWSASNRKWRVAACSLAVAISALAATWHHDQWYLFPKNEVARCAGDEACPVLLQAVSRDTPRTSPPTSRDPLDSTSGAVLTRLPVDFVSIQHAGRWIAATGRAELLVEGQLSTVSFGDRLEIAGTLQRTRVPRNPGEPDFASMRRANRQLVVVHCRHPECVTVLDRGRIRHPYGAIARFRRWAAEQLIRHVGPEQGPLAGALLLGERERLDRDQVNQFFLTGTLHLLAISGLHLGILASALWVLFRWDRFPRNRVLVVIGVLAVLYAVLTGGRPPVVRAAILIAILCIARGLGRSPRSWNSLAAAAVITLAFRPAGLFDCGTQLSFLAVATIIGWWPIAGRRRPVDALQRLIEKSRPWPLRWLNKSVCLAWQLLSLTGVIWIISAPLVAFRFHLVAPIGIPLNLALWLPVSVALLSGWAVIAVAAVIPPLAFIPGFLCSWSLTAIEILTGVAQDVPGGHWFLAGPTLLWVLGFYVSIVAARFPLTPATGRWACRALLAWLLIGVLTSSEFRRVRNQYVPHPLSVSFAAVGHGTSVLVEFPNGRNLLYDAGQRGSSRWAAMSISSLLWSRGINHLDAIVLSHADVDHFNAVPFLLDRFAVGAILIAPAMYEQSAPATEALITAIRAHRIPLQLIQESDRLIIDPTVHLRILHPPPDVPPENDNANSVVLEISSGGHRLLLPGDLEQDGLDELLSEMPRDYDVIMAPHHGSSNSRPDEFLAWSTPDHVIVSSNRHHLDATKLERDSPPNATFYYTARVGAVTVTINDRNVQITTHR